MCAELMIDLMCFSRKILLLSNITTVACSLQMVKIRKNVLILMHVYLFIIQTEQTNKNLDVSV